MLKGFEVAEVVVVAAAAAAGAGAEIAVGAMDWKSVT